MTIPNILLNNLTTPDDDESSSLSQQQLDLQRLASMLRLGSGDWMNLSKQLVEETTTGDDLLPSPSHCYFDLILAAETLYSLDTCRDTALFLSRHLRHDSGVAYLATKRYYFGVGGGTKVFTDYCCNDSGLQVQVVQVIDNGTGNIREILKVTRTRTNTTTQE